MKCDYKLKAFVLICTFAVIISITSCSTQGRQEGVADKSQSGSAMIMEPDRESAIDIAKGKSLKRDSIVHMLSVAMKWVVMFPGTTAPVTGPTMIDDGIFIIEPVNPFTGKKMTFSKEYSPGEVYIYMGDMNPGEPGQILHYDPSEPKYDEQLVSSGNWIIPEEQLTRQKFNGRTEKIEAFEEVHYDPPPYAEIRATFGYAELPDAAVRVLMVEDQVDYLMDCYSPCHDEIPPSLDSYINWLGSRNPKVWINPYTGQEMTKVPLVETETPETHKTNPYYVPALPKPSEIGDYPGNYAYEVYTGHNGDLYSIARFYYLDADGLLQSKECLGVPRDVLLEWGRGLAGG